MRWVGVFLSLGLIWAPSAQAIPKPPEIPPVLNEGCPESPLQSCTSPGGPIYLPLDSPFISPARDYQHEIGHQFDYQVMTDPWRDRFRALIGDSRPWRSSPNSPHEQFAQAYMLCAMHGNRIKRKRHRQGYDYRPTPRQHARACQLIRDAYYQSAPSLPASDVPDSRRRYPVSVG